MPRGITCRGICTGLTTSVAIPRKQLWERPPGRDLPELRRIGRRNLHCRVMHPAAVFVTDRDGYRRAE